MHTYTVFGSTPPPSNAAWAAVFFVGRKEESLEEVWSARTNPMRLLLFLLALQLSSCHARKRQHIVEEDGSVGWSCAKKAEIETATAAEAHERGRREKAGLTPLPLYPTHSTTCNGRPCRPGEGNMKGYQMWNQASSCPP